VNPFLRPAILSFQRRSSRENSSSRRRCVTDSDARTRIAWPRRYCGMKYLPREVADGKLRAMVEAAKRLREKFAARP
jgi:methionine synthase II (cobalamin-independent)